jgi:hypothetical protein
LGIISLAVAAWLIRGMFFQKQYISNAIPGVKDQDKESGKPAKEFFAINGVQTTQNIAEARPFAVVVENHPDSRPQSGLVGADIVYETLAEGGITRFLAVYQSKEVKSIGPVRSARTYFADLANELHAVFVHVGGNSDALENIRNKQYLDIADVDEFFLSPYFTRSKDRPMPHNVYTSIQKLQKYISDSKINNRISLELWNFKDQTKVAPVAVNITVPFSEKSYEVVWKYSVAENSYVRFMAGASHKNLETKEQIKASAIIVQSVETFPVKSDTVGAIGLMLTGEGQGYVFQDGSVKKVFWKKSGSGRTRYFEQNGNEIAFNRGQIWVQLLPSELGVSWK